MQYLPNHVSLDEKSVTQIHEQFERFGVFKQHCVASDDCDVTGTLIALTTQDVVPQQVQDDLLSAESRGKDGPSKHEAHLINKTASFFTPMKRKNAKTLSTMYQVTCITIKAEIKIVKSDRKLIQHLFNASQAGRHVR